MKYLLILSLLAVNTWAVDESDIEGTWYRTYGVFRPWTDNNQGTMTTYEEDLIFHSDGTVYIYDKNTDSFKGKSLYTITERDDEDFLVFYTPDQDPEDDMIQQKQGYFVSISSDKDKHKMLNMATTKEHKKNKKFKGISYKRVKKSYGNTEFVVPQNNI